MATSMTSTTSIPSCSPSLPPSSARHRASTQHFFPFRERVRAQFTRELFVSHGTIRAALIFTHRRLGGDLVDHRYPLRRARLQHDSPRAVARAAATAAVSRRKPSRGASPKKTAVCATSPRPPLPPRLVVRRAVGVAVPPAPVPDLLRLLIVKPTRLVAEQRTRIEGNKQKSSERASNRTDRTPCRCARPRPPSAY